MSLKYMVSNTLTKEKIIISILLLLFPILDQYAGIIDQISLGESLLIISLFYILIKYGTNFLDYDRLDSYKFYFIFLIISFLLSFMNSLFYSASEFLDFFNLFLRMVLYAIFIIILGSFAFDKKYTLKIYSFISCFMIIYLLMQYVFYYSFDIILPTFLKIIPIKPSLVDYANRDLEYVYSISFRPSAFFSEPAKMAQFLFPFLLYLLINNNEDKYKIFKIILTTMGMILSTSFLGFLLVCLCYIFYFFCTEFTKNKKVLLFSFVLIFSFLFLFTDLITSNINRMLSGLQNSAGTSSASLRLLRGWEIFIKVPLFNKFFGVGLNCIGPFLNNNNVIIYFGGTYLYSEYSNTFTYILDTLGIAGMIFFLIFILQLYKSSNKYTKILILIMLIMSLGSSFLVTPTWVFLMTFIFYSKNIFQLDCEGE